MTKKIYGISPDQKITPQIVAAAMTDCFYQAHCDSEEFEQADSKVSHNYCLSIVKKAFNQTGGDYENPTKESILEAIQYLKDFSKNFRSQEIVNKNFIQITKLIEKINEN